MALRTRRDALARALRVHLGPDCLPILPTGGLHLWCALPNGVSDIEVEQRAAALGILVSAGHHWYPAEPSAPFLRLSFAAAQLGWIEDCVADLSRVIHSEISTRFRQKE
jgi:DNA-binding transcriptional MocR family regulator